MSQSQQAPQPKPCNLVVIVTETGGIAVSPRVVGKEVKTGDLLFGGRVLFARPDPCVLTNETIVKATKQVSYSLERLNYNVVITVNYGGTVERYVYPIKVWETVERIVKRFFARKPPQQGFVFYGPPGTGKTSLAKLIAQMYGLMVHEIRPQDILSKWVGESERNLATAFEAAKKSEPSIILVDDCDWLFRPRELRAESSTGSIEFNLMKILLEYIESFYLEQRKILVIGTTNAPLSLIDVALVRSGRLGKPVHIPLPDYEAIYEFLVREGIPREKAQIWAVNAVNMGLGMADVKLDLLEQLKEGVEPFIEPKVERGYARYTIYIPKEYEEQVREYFQMIDRTGDFTQTVRERQRRLRRTVLWFAGPENVALAVANAFITYYGKLPAITLLSSRYVLDAVDAANTLSGFIIVPYSVIRHGVVDPSIFKTAFSVAYVGEGAVEGVRINIVEPSRSSNRAVVETALAAITLSFYVDKADRQHVEKIVAYSRNRGIETTLKLLDKLGYYGLRPEHLEYFGG